MLQLDLEEDAMRINYLLASTTLPLHATPTAVPKNREPPHTAHLEHVPLGTSNSYTDDPRVVTASVARAAALDVCVAPLNPFG